MKASLTQRVEYITQQLLQARMALRMIDRHLKTSEVLDPLREVFEQTDERLEKVARVLQGAEPPIARQRGRDVMDFDAEVHDPNADPETESAVRS